jgi:hypothetical protein
MTRNRESGVALLSAILVLMLMSALLIGFVAMVNADQMASGINRDQTQAYAAAHAGIEKLTSDLGQLFESNFSPTGDDIATLTADGKAPSLPGITFVGPNATSGYSVSFIDEDEDENPDLDEPNGTTISAGAYEGLTGLITPYTIEVTARTAGNAEVRMRRTVQTVAIPVFQFGIFSENNQSFFAGPNFAFGGRVHTNQHLFLKQDNTGTLTLKDRVTAVGEIIRTHLSNGETTHTGDVRMARASNCPDMGTGTSQGVPPAQCFNLTVGSLVGNIGSAVNDPAWADVSLGDALTESNGWIKNGRTGATRLDLPIVSDGAAPVDLIRRPPTAEAVDSSIGRQRFYNMGTLRILISDRPEDLTGLPGVVRTLAGVNASPIRLAGVLNVSAAERAANANTLPAGNHPFAVTPAMADNTAVRDRLRDGYRTTAGTSLIDGWILINRQDRNGDWTDVTKEILNLGFAGRRISNGNLDVVDLNNACVNPHPNAIIRVQRYRDTDANCAAAAAAGENGDRYWPNVLYDAREGMLRDDQNNRPTATNPSNVTNVANSQPRLWWGGVMHYVELDVRNLRRWLRGELLGSNTAACIDGAGTETCPMDVTGFVVYFSDRRGNRNFGADAAADVAAFDATGPVYVDDQETGDFGFEDNINPANANSQPNGVMDGAFVDAQGVNRFAEDINQNAATVPLPETYGGTARTLPFVPAAGWPNAPYAANQMLRLSWSAADAAMTPAGNVYQLFGTPGVFGVPIDRNVARVNRAFFFRRGLKLVNGGRGFLPANGSQGLTVASENPVYIQGNYNACTNANPSNANPTPFSPACVGGVGFGTQPSVDHVSAAVIADSVTFLSNAWNDIRSFVNPHEATRGPDNNTGVTFITGGIYDARQAITTWYRLGIIGGKGLSFTRPGNNDRDHSDFGTDGGAHNFLRFIENWGGATLNYRGSLVSFYTSRQAVGIYKCCDIVYTAPNRGYVFDTEFLQPRFLPPRTPMFRDINTLTFRQILRPTQ